MGSVVKTYCQYNIPFHHYYRPSSSLQNPISLFAITSPSISPTDPSSPPPPPPPSSKQKLQTQFGGHLIIPTVAVAASAWFFLRRLHRYPPIITAPPLDVELEEEGGIREIPLQQKPGHVKALHFYKTKPGTVFKMIQVYADGNYESLKARIRLSAQWLETARRELEEVVERDPGRVMEYSQVVDELMDLLRDMEVYVDQCEKDKVKGYLRSCNRLLARVRTMEARILNALKEFHDDEEQGGGDNY
ncbi:unnamed protein product [Eruca vesicaria subsp. sativa]|uniref:Uncharacterized protein n=1 Tax=Eruca vesicaria subsp. sativa TaxID=29727 RepID=A0ABC8J903_ERUVS|nr:unnamed protein product [Eruca vesicaria subsp. sativa]